MTIGIRFKVHINYIALFVLQNLAQIKVGEGCFIYVILEE